MSRPQTIFRVPKDADHPFVMADHTLLEDPRISFRAKGILVYLLAKPDDWVLRVTDLVRHGNGGRYHVRMALLELRAAGYIHMRKIRSSGRFVQYRYEIYEVPRERDPSLGPVSMSDFQAPEKPALEKPHSVNQQVEIQQMKNRILNNNDSTNKDG